MRGTKGNALKIFFCKIEVLLQIVQRNIRCFPVIGFVFPKRDVEFKRNEFHIRHLGKGLRRARPVTPHVSHCVRVTLILVEVVLSKCRKLKQ